MKKIMWILIGVGILLALVIIFFVLTNNNGNTAGAENNNLQDARPVKCKDMSCLGISFQTCTPAELTMSQGDQNFVMTIYGFENEKCRYTMIMNGITAADCYFKEEQLNDKVLNQMFGNKEGQDAIIAEACGTS